MTATLRRALALHWPEYLIEAAGLGLFIVVAGVSVILVNLPGTLRAVASPGLRRAAVGVAMGLTAVALIYSPWGMRSGAHLNPAVTLSFLRLGKVAPADALFYIAAQFAGGGGGALLMTALLGGRFTMPPVSAVVTQPGAAGVMAAFAAEIAMAFGLMTTVLRANASPRLMRWSGLCAGALIAIYIAVEAPVSGMSLNPARSVASALPSGLWHGIWIYLTAPPLGMLLAAEIHLRRGCRTPCAKLHHGTTGACIFRCDFSEAQLREASHA
jgi:aquaporin Z